MIFWRITYTRTCIDIDTRHREPAWKRCSPENPEICSQVSNHLGGTLRTVTVYTMSAFSPAFRFVQHRLTALRNVSVFSKFRLSSLSRMSAAGPATAQSNVTHAQSTMAECNSGGPIKRISESAAETGNGILPQGV